TKKLGVLIRDARLAARRKPSECAEAIGVKNGIFRAYEDGRKAPHYPNLKPLSIFWIYPLTTSGGRRSARMTSRPMKNSIFPNLWLSASGRSARSFGRNATTPPFPFATSHRKPASPADGSKPTN